MKEKDEEMKSWTQQKEMGKKVFDHLLKKTKQNENNTVGKRQQQQT